MENDLVEGRVLPERVTSPPSKPAATTSKGKDRTQLMAVLRRVMEQCDVQRADSILVLGASRDDFELLDQLGFTNVTVSNVSPCPIANAKSQLILNAGSIDLPDDSFDIVFAHAVLHHCRSPHKALCEMLRTARKQVIFFEPNDSALMRMLIRARLSFPYEIPAVVDNGFTAGGLEDTHIPNFIYRWNANELHKTAYSFMAEREFTAFAYPYWDFYVNESELAIRAQTRIGEITKVIGAKNFIRMLQFGQSILNLFPPLRAQGNKFVAGIKKQPQLRPWLKLGPEGVVFDRAFVETSK